MNMMSRCSIKELPDVISEFLSNHTDKVLSNIERSQQFLSNKIDDFGGQIVILKAEISKLKAENEQLKKSLSMLSTETAAVTDVVHKHEVNLDMHQREKISANVILLGIPRVPNENTKSLFDATCQTLGLEFPNSSIVSCARLAAAKGESQPIKITFSNIRDKEALIAKKKQFGLLKASMIGSMRWPHGWSNKIYIRDDLSPLSMDIFRELKKHQSSLNFQYVWPSRNGTILVKTSQDSRPIKVQNRTELNKLISSRQ